MKPNESSLSIQHPTTQGLFFHFRLCYTRSMLQAVPVRLQSSLKKKISLMRGTGTITNQKKFKDSRQFPDITSPT